MRIISTVNFTMDDAGKTSSAHPGMGKEEKSRKA
jgi:hypothetical protein